MFTAQRMHAQVQLVDASKAALVERERALLTDALSLLDEVCPQVGLGVASSALADHVRRRVDSCSTGQRCDGTGRWSNPSLCLLVAMHRWTSGACWQTQLNSWTSCSCWWWLASSTQVRL
jgi:hypothetical protein